MIKLFRKIRKKRIEQGKTANYLKYTIGDILLGVIADNILCPFRDNMLVDIIRTKIKARAFRYDIYNEPKGTLNNPKNICYQDKVSNGTIKIETIW